MTAPPDLFTVDGTDHAMGEGDVIYLAPNAPHSLGRRNALPVTLVMVHPTTDQQTGHRLIPEADRRAACVTAPPADLMMGPL